MTSCLFNEAADYGAFLQVLGEATVPPLRVLAYRIMPAHWHVVLRPAADRRARRNGQETVAELKGQLFVEPTKLPLTVPRATML